MRRRWRGEDEGGRNERRAANISNDQAEPSLPASGGQARVLNAIASPVLPWSEPTIKLSTPLQDVYPSSLHDPAAFPLIVGFPRAHRIRKTTRRFSTATPQLLISKQPPALTSAMAPIAHFNYTTLGLSEFEVFPFHIYDQQILVEAFLREVLPKSDLGSRVWLVGDSTTRCNILLRTYHPFPQLKEPIPFNQVDSNPWLLNVMTDLTEHATRLFRAERLFDVWTDRNHRCLHAVIF